MHQQLQADESAQSAYILILPRNTRTDLWITSIHSFHNLPLIQHSPTHHRHDSQSPSRRQFSLPLQRSNAEACSIILYSPNTLNRKICRRDPSASRQQTFDALHAWWRQGGGGRCRNHNATAPRNHNLHAPPVMESFSAPTSPHRTRAENTILSIVLE